MFEKNNLASIQNKLDALVEKIVQKENSDEDFRITYAQILEKINTKMDVFSGNENFDKLGLMSLEIRNLLKERQEVVDSKFNAIKGEFDHLNDILAGSLKTPELLVAFDKLQNQIHFFSEEQENQKEAFNSIISHIEKFGTLEETNDNMRANFAIVKEQNTIINENLAKQFDTINAFNTTIEESNAKSLESLKTVIFTLKEFEDSLNEDFDSIKEFVTEKTDSIINKAHETDSFIDILNNNVNTMMQVIGNIFEDEAFQDVQSDVTDVLTKTAFISEALKNIATKEEAAGNKEDIKKHVQELLASLEQKIADSFSEITENNEKILIGTETIKDEVWSIKDLLCETKAEQLTTKDFDKKIETIATTEQLKAISSTIEDLRKDLSDIVLNEQNEQITSALNNLQTKFVTQLIQIADNISFAEEADEICETITNSTDNVKYSIEQISEELREKMLSDITIIRQDIAQLKDSTDNEVLTRLEKCCESFQLLTNGYQSNREYIYTLPDVETDFTKVRQDISNLQKIFVNPDTTQTEQTNDLVSTVNTINNSVTQILNSPLNQQIAEVRSLFGLLNEDVSSISKRTNKLILSSDEVSKTLRKNIDGFTGVIKNFDKQSRAFYNSPVITELNKNVNNIAQSNQIMNEAFMYLAEWIDSASESFENIQSNVERITNITNDLSEKISEIDTKVSQLEQQQTQTKEIKDLLEYMASQISVTNEKIIENEALLKKIAVMEKQLKKIETNVDVITEYLDEEIG